MPCQCATWPSFEGPYDGERFHHPMCERSKSECHWCAERWPFDVEEPGTHVISADGISSTVPCLNPSNAKKVRAARPAKKRKADEPYICPTCYRQNGEHLYDCELRMMGAGIRDPKERERVMLAALADEFEL